MIEYPGANIYIISISFFSRNVKKMKSPVFHMLVVMREG
jgi:hypothetical protein